MFHQSLCSGVKRNLPKPDTKQGPFATSDTCGAPIETTTILGCCALFLDNREFQVMNAEH